MKDSSGALATRLGEHRLETPLVAACGTVGSVVEFAGVADLSNYGAAVAKSVSGTPWAGRRKPRMASSGTGMLNGIGIQNPGVEKWVEEVAPLLAELPTQVWGSSVGKDAEEFGVVAAKLATSGVAAIEVNLSCPNLESGRMFALDLAASVAVVGAVRQATDLPIGAKLTPNSEDIVRIAAGVAQAGADWVVLGNTVWGAGFDVKSRKPLLSGVIGGYSGAPIKPISLRCVWEVSRALPELPIVGTGGVATGDDVVEYLLAGASAVGLGTAHFAQPNIASKIISQLGRYMKRHKISQLEELVGAAEPW